MINGTIMGENQYRHHERAIGDIPSAQSQSGEGAERGRDQCRKYGNDETVVDRPPPVPVGKEVFVPAQGIPFWIKRQHFRCEREERNCIER